MIVLNEEEYLGKNLEQHYEFADRIVVVEGADRLYPPQRVTERGLSTDRTAEIVQSFPDPDHKITFIQHGWTSMGGVNAKCELRNRYMEYIDPGLLIVIDADEFYRKQDLRELIDNMRRHPQYSAYTVPQIHFWHSQKHFITGGYYDVPHTRFWHVRRGDRYTDNHNHPSRNGRSLMRGYVRVKHRVVRDLGGGYSYVFPPVCFHYGFMKSQENVEDKTRYYENRGERSSRAKTWRSRKAWFDEAVLRQEKLALHRYGGEVPECFAPQCGVGLAGVAMASQAPNGQGQQGP
jgi:hypothetical protein